MKEFDKLENIETSTSLFLSNNYYISDKKYVNYIEFLPNMQFRGKQRLMNFLNKPNTILKLKKQHFDIFHPTYYNTYFLKSLGTKAFVLTVYDMIHEKFSDMFLPTDKTSEQKRLLVEKATKIIAISESTKKDLIELFGTDESKIEVVYLGNSMFPKRNSKIELDIPIKYILFVGSRAGYKNFLRFVKSVSSILNEDKKLFILCAGGGIFTAQEIELFTQLNIKKQILQYNLDDDSLAYFYKNAMMFIFPSLYEGFGIPVLESFACECPLLCSNTSSLPEIAGEGALYFDPYSEISIKSAVLQIIENKKIRENLREKGRERLKVFSWKQTAFQTKNIYESILK
jgi:glycosyltransferase involved in cell wall biosynthesis